jgi:hypothetical protein
MEPSRRILALPFEQIRSARTIKTMMRIIQQAAIAAALPRMVFLREHFLCAEGGFAEDWNQSG